MFTYVVGGLKLTWICENDLCSQKSHQFAPFDAEGFRHDHDERISPGSAHHRKADARISGACLDDCLSRLEVALFFGPFYRSKGEAILDGSTWVRSLALDINVDAGRSHSLKLNDGCLSNGLGDGGVDR